MVKQSNFMKLCLKCLACFWAFISFFQAMLAVADDDSLAALQEFLKGSDVPSVVSAQMVNCIADKDRRQNIVLESDGLVYALALRNLPTTSTPDTLAYLKTGILKATLKKATGSLPLSALCPQYENMGYKNRDVIISVLLHLNGNMESEGYLASGLQTQAQILHGYVIVLAYIPKENIRFSRYKLPPESDFRAAYCRELVLQAQATPDDDKQDTRVALYLEIFSLNCIMDIDLTLKAAEFLIQSGNRNICSDLLPSLFQDSLQQMSSIQAEQLGNLLFDLGYEEKAEKAYEFALDKLHNSQ